MIGRLLPILLLLAAPAWGLTSISVYKTFTAEILTFGDLNSSFSRLLDSGINPLIALHPGDSTSTINAVHDSLDGRTAGYNIGIKRSLIFRDQDDSLVVGGTADFDTVRIDSLTMVQGNRATFRSLVRIDSFTVGAALPAVGFASGSSPPGRVSFGTLVAIDSVRIRDSLTVAPGARSTIPRARIDTLLIGSATPVVGFAVAASAGQRTMIAYGRVDTVISDTTYITAPRAEDLHLASGAVIYWNGVDVTITHAANVLTMNGGDLVVADGNGQVIGNSAQISANVGAAEFQILGAGGADASGIIGAWSADAFGPAFAFVKSRNAAIGSFTIVQSGDVVGTFHFAADDGTDYATVAASISAAVDGTPGVNDMPGRLIFSTTADGASAVIERLRITNAGDMYMQTAGSGFSIGTTGIDALGLRILKASANVGISLERTTDVTATGSLYADVNGALNIVTETNHDIEFLTNNLGRMRLSQAGNLYIGGQVDASYPLHVVGAGFFTGGVRIGVDSSNNLIDDASTGAATATLYIGNASINVTSDIRAKRDVQNWHGDALALLRQAQVVDFEYDRAAIHDASEWGPASRGRYVGIAAQNMRQWAPWAVNAGDAVDCPVCNAGLYCEVHQHLWKAEYEHLVPLLVSAIQELEAEVNTLKARMN